MIDLDRHAPRDLAELAAALATDEHNAGANRNSRRLLERALRDPTENVVAQAMWAGRNGVGIVVAPSLLQRVPRHFEADALRFYFSGSWGDSLRASQQWLGDEPFSSRPAIQASFVAAVALQDYRLSARIAERGLTSNPGDFALHNNLAFALAHEGRFLDAGLHLAQARRAADNTTKAVVVAATSGLLALREGDLDRGRRQYASALEAAQGHEYLALSVRAYRAIELLGVGAFPSEVELKAVLKSLSEWPRPEARVLHMRLVGALPDAVRDRLRFHAG